MQARRLIRIAVAAVALGLVGAAWGAATKPTLTVAISGDGSVTSHPAGINCHPTCKLHVRTGLKVTLTASPNNGSEFSHWSAPCGTSFKCMVTVTGSRVVRAFFKTPPPPAPPPPLAAAGHYSVLGDYLHFDVSTDGRTVANLFVRASLPCQPSNMGISGVLLPVTVPGPITIQPDHTFSVDFQDPSPPMEKLSLSGTFDTAGNASGTFTIHAALDLNTHYECDSGPIPWAAKLQ